MTDQSTYYVSNLHLKHVNPQFYPSSVKSLAALFEHTVKTAWT